LTISSFLIRCRLEKVLGPEHPDVATSLNNLAALYEDQGKYSEAEPLLKRALQIRERALGPNNLYFAQSLMNLANLYRYAGRQADAERLYKQSLEIEEKLLGQDNSELARGIYNLAAFYVAQGRYVDAEPLHKKSLQIRTKVLGPDHPDVGRSLNSLAELYEAEGRFADALPLVRAAAKTGFAQKSVYLAALTGAASKSIITSADFFNEGYQVVQQAAASAASKAINQLSIRFAAGNGQLAQLVRKDQDLSAEAARLDRLIVEAVSKDPSKRDPAVEQQIRDRLQSIASERTEIGATLYQLFPDYAALTQPQPLSVQETKDLLADDEALIVFDFDRRSFAGIFSHSDAGALELNISAAELEAQVKTLRASLIYAPQFDVESSYKLYRLIFGPLAEYIATKKRLSVVANGALTSFPLQLLVAKDPAGVQFKDIDWLIRKYAITVYPSASSLKILHESKNVVEAPRPMIGFGDPLLQRKTQANGGSKAFEKYAFRGVIADTKSLTEALSPLPETADELRAMASKLGAGPEDIKLEEAASVTNVKRARLDTYRVVYFATHALVAGDVEKFAHVNEEPALVLSIPEKPSDEDDGLLRASDVATLRMNADFVVLSACNTAEADSKPGAEALSGLARAFFYAGARSLIVSNWEVDSESTVTLMTGFFDALKNGPHLTRAEALRLAMLQMIEKPHKPEWAQPKYWGPFTVVGEPQKN
jgi:CHAT domain-containing protein